MKLYLQGHDYRYAVEQMMMTLFPGQKPDYPEHAPDGISPAAQVTLEQTADTVTARAKLWWEGKVCEAERFASVAELTGGLDDDRVRQRIIRFAFYDAGIAALGHEPPWGALTGVRPVKLPTRWMSDGIPAVDAAYELGFWIPGYDKNRPLWRCPIYLGESSVMFSLSRAGEIMG